METVRELVPSQVRLWVYALYVLAALAVGAVAAWTEGSLDWIPAAERTLAYLAGPLALLAAVNVNPDEGDAYNPQHVG